MTLRFGLNFRAAISMARDQDKRDKARDLLVQSMAGLAAKAASNNPPTIKIKVVTIAQFSSAGPYKCPSS